MLLNVALFINNNRSVSNICNFGKLSVYLSPILIGYIYTHFDPNVFHISEIKSTRSATAISSMMIVKVHCILILFCVLAPFLNGQRNKEFEFPNDGTPNGGFVINNDGEQNGGFVINDDGDDINFGETETNGPFDGNEGSGDDSAGHTSSSGALSTLILLSLTFIARELIFHA